MLSEAKCVVVVFDDRSITARAKKLIAFNCPWACAVPISFIRNAADKLSANAHPFTLGRQEDLGCKELFGGVFPRVAAHRWCFP